MNISRYRIFVEVVKQGSITAAAHHLNYTQPNVSQQISSLEREYGFPLLLRSRNGVVLSENGKKLYPLFCKIVNLEQQIQELVNNIHFEPAGTLRIAGFLSIMIYWMPDVLKTFAAEYPMIKIEAFEAEIDEQIQMFMDNKLDLGILSSPPPAGFNFIPLADDPIVVLLPSGHPLLQKKYLSVQDLTEYTLILPHDSVSEISRYIFTNKLNVLKKQHVIRSDLSIIHMVSKNLGIGITGKLLTKKLPHGVFIRHFKEKYFRTLGIVIPQHSNSPLVKLFIKVICDVFQEEKYRQSKCAENLSNGKAPLQP